MSRLQVQIKQQLNGTLPLQQTDGSAGYDLYAREEMTIPPGESRVVPCGFSIALPQGWVALICSRSGLAMRDGIFVLNAPGVVDSDYRGEVSALMFNVGLSEYNVSEGQRIAQMLIQAYLSPQLVLAKELPPTERGEGGFGSTGRGSFT